jgi:hypothetical protein
MTKLAHHIALALALSAPLAIAAPALAQNSMATAPSAEAQRFSVLYMPIELSLESAIAGFNKEFEPAISADANVVALEKSKPGLIAAAGNAGRNAMTRIMRRDLPAAQEQIAAYAAANMTSTELSQINSFFESGAGMRLQQLIAANADTSGIAEQTRDTGAIPKLEGGQLLAMVDPALITKLSKEDLAALLKFGTTQGGRKLDALSKPLADLVAAEMNKIVSEMTPEIEKSVIEAITQHLKGS